MITRAVVTEVRPHEFVTEASTLIGNDFNTDLGNGQPFILSSIEHDREGDVVAWHFRQAAGIIRLTVFND
jgi:hypothetical protein